jgi:hypothetical protein
MASTDISNKKNKKNSAGKGMNYSFWRGRITKTQIGCLLGRTEIEFDQTNWISNYISTPTRFRCSLGRREIGCDHTNSISNYIWTPTRFGCFLGRREIGCDHTNLFSNYIWNPTQFGCFLGWTEIWCGHRTIWGFPKGELRFSSNKIIQISQLLDLDFLIYKFPHVLWSNILQD